MHWLAHRLVLAAVLATCVCMSNAAQQAESSAGNNATDQDHLIWSLLLSYNMNARPTIEAVNVTLGFYLESIDNLEEREQILHVSAYVEAAWYDRRLHWEPSKWGGVDYITLPANMIWKPDFALINSAGDIYNKAFYSSYYLIEVTYDGAISWTPHGPMAIRCVPDLTYYPFDSQTCHFRFENWVYRSSLCRLSPMSDSINLENFIGSGEWSITNSSAIGVDVSYFGYSNYSDVFFYITLKRKTWFFILNVVFPSALMSALVCFVFVLPAESDEKVSLNITLLLSFVVLLLNISQEMPRTSDYTPLLSRYITLVTSTSAVSLLCTIFVLRVSHSGRKEVPQWVHRIVIEKLGRIFCLVPPKEECDSMVELPPNHSFQVNRPTKADEKALPCKDSPLLKDILGILIDIERFHSRREKIEARQHAWNAVGIVIDRVLFCVFVSVTLLATIYIIVIMPAHSG